MTLHANMFQGRFCVIDAPCGMGKTWNVRQYLARLDSTVSQLCPTFRTVSSGCIVPYTMYNAHCIIHRVQCTAYIVRLGGNVIDLVLY